MRILEPNTAEQIRIQLENAKFVLRPILQNISIRGDKNITTKEKQLNSVSSLAHYHYSLQIIHRTPSF